jgi:hypothetical protein
LLAATKHPCAGEFTPGKFGEWRFDKRTHGGKPIPRHMEDPPKNMRNDLVRRGRTEMGAHVQRLFFLMRRRGHTIMGMLFSTL